jgi:uncharacterized membrane protein YphA (DoxX/SURF4 family)
MPPAPSPILRPWAALCARVVLGLIFGMAGTYKTFVLTPVGHYEQYFQPFSDTWLPGWALWFAGVTVPLVEFAGGWLVVVGFRVRDALVALGIVLIVVTYGHLLENHLYDFTGHVIPRLGLLIAVALLATDDRYSVDAWLCSRRVPST